MANQPFINSKQSSKSVISARKILLSGKVQGVGFRPFVYRLAILYGLAGWVRNCMGTVEIHVQGQANDIEDFIANLLNQKPLLASPVIQKIEMTDSEVFETFSILQSQQQGESQVSVPTDLFLCDDCLKELNDSSDRRFRYPFINCTQCGPRFTLIRALPYDRVNTSMHTFELCDACLAEYENPSDRRFHAEPVACPDCGPSLSYKQNELEIINDSQQSLKHAVSALRQGKILAIKGIGGYHLICDATNSDVVQQLRKRKHRPDKPLAIMFPAAINDPYEIVDKYVRLTDKDKAFLSQPSRPILLVNKNEHSNLSELIAPALNEVGVMLPYSPLHHLLLNDFAGPLVATSANISGEPVLINNDEVEHRLDDVADAFLHHDRPIEHPADDPVFRMINVVPRPVRIGRGMAPLELILPFTLEQPVLAVGAQMKNTITLAWSNRAVISSHIGEMHSARSLQVFKDMINDLQTLYAVKAEQIICDAHNAYSTSRWARSQKIPVHEVYHHYAHASAAYYECKTDSRIIAFTWDGTGLGEDGTLWGGEALHGKPGQWKRVASMRPFYLPGGDKAGSEPWRSAAALCWETGRNFDAIPDNDPIYKEAWQRKLNCPKSTSVGRLFDAAVALTGIRKTVSYEGQGPMELEALCKVVNQYIELPLSQSADGYVADWEPLINEMLNTQRSIEERASIFHYSLAYTLLKQSIAIRNDHATNIVSFSGGVFQNKVLTELAINLLQENGFEVSLPSVIPLNDAGISFGQIVEYGFRS